jgi:hypothetical protein
MVMRGRTARSIYALLVMVIAVALVGCATAPSGSSGPAGKSQPDLLQEAGFTLYTPKSPEHLAYLNTLPAKKVVSNKFKGQVHYLVCTDPNSKQCYLGNKAAYQRYQQLAIQASLAADQHQVSEERMDPVSWSMWVDSQGGP